MVRRSQTRQLSQRCLPWATADSPRRPCPAFGPRERAWKSQRRRASARNPSTPTMLHKVDAARLVATAHVPPLFSAALARGRGTRSSICDATSRNRANRRASNAVKGRRRSPNRAHENTAPRRGLVDGIEGRSAKAHNHANGWRFIANRSLTVSIVTSPPEVPSGPSAPASRLAQAAQPVSAVGDFFASAQIGDRGLEMFVGVPFAPTLRGRWRCRCAPRKTMLGDLGAYWMAC